MIYFMVLGLFVIVIPLISFFETILAVMNGVTLTVLFPLEDACL